MITRHDTKKNIKGKLAALEKKLKIIVHPKALYKGKICDPAQASLE